MACIGCNKTCACALTAGDGIVIEGTGNAGNPWVVSAVGASEFVDATCSITISGDGSLGTPLTADLNIATEGGLKCTEAIGVGIKADPASTAIITFSSDGIRVDNGTVYVSSPCLSGTGTNVDPITIVLDPDGCLFCDADGLDIKVDPILGLTCGGDGLGILIDPAAGNIASVSVTGLYVPSSGAVISVTAPCLVGDGSGGDPINLVYDPDGGIICDTDGISILLDPLSDPSCASLSADGLLITCGSGGTVSVTDPITGDGSGGNPLGLALAATGGLDLAAGELEILLDPATDPSCGSLSAAGLLISCGGGGCTPFTTTEAFAGRTENPVLAGSSGQAPTAVAGTWTVDGTYLAVGSSAEAKTVWFVDSVDFTFETVIHINSGDGGPIFFWDNNLGYYYLFEPVGGFWTLYHFKGSFVQIGSPTAVAPANDQTITIVVDGPLMSFYINSVLVIGPIQNIAVSPSPFVGFRANNSAAGKITSVSVVPSCA